MKKKIERTGKNPHRNPATRKALVKVDHLKEEAEMYLRGFTQREIAAKLGISQKTVSLDLAELRERWVASTAVNFNEVMGAELAKIDEQERTYREQFENEMITKKVIKQIPVYKNKKGESFIDKDGKLHLEEDLELVRTGEVVTEESITISKGEARWLEGIDRCIDKRCKIFGLYRTVSQDGGGGITEIPAGNLKAQMALVLSIFDEEGQ